MLGGLDGDHTVTVGAREGQHGVMARFRAAGKALEWDDRR